MNTLNGTAYILMIDTVTPLTSLRGTAVNYRPIACGISNGFNLDIESISTRNKDDGGYDSSLGGYVSWGMDLDGFAIGLKNADKILKANFNEIALLAKSKKPFFLKWEDALNSVTREGKVRITSYRETASLEEPYSFTVNFVGIGEPYLAENIYKTVLSTTPEQNELLSTSNNELIQTT